MSLITLGAHLGDNSVDQGPLSAPSLGTTGGCHAQFTWLSTARHLQSVSWSHPAVDQAHRADLRVYRSSPLSTAPTTTTSSSISYQNCTAVSPEPISPRRSPRVTIPVQVTARYCRASRIHRFEPEGLS